MYAHLCVCVNLSMTSRAEDNQILLGIMPKLAAKLFVVNLEIGHCATRLASPAVTTEHLVTQTVVLVGIEPQACMLRSEPSHDAFSATWCRNVRFSSPGRNLKNRNADCRRTLGFSFSRFAPAMKSAQIISRQ